jgi:hypothetical protein
MPGMPGMPSMPGTVCQYATRTKEPTAVLALLQ